MNTPPKCPLCGHAPPEPTKPQPEPVLIRFIIPDRLMFTEEIKVRAYPERGTDDRQLSGLEV